MQVTFNTQTDDVNELLTILNLVQEAIRKKQQPQQNTQTSPFENQNVKTNQIPVPVIIPDYGFNQEENAGVASAISNLVQDLNKEKENSRLANEGFFRAPKPLEVPQQIPVQPVYQQVPQQVQQPVQQEPKKPPERTAGGGKVVPFVDLSNTMGKIFSSDYGTRKEGRKI